MGAQFVNLGGDFGAIMHGAHFSTMDSATQPTPPPPAGVYGAIMHGARCSAEMCTRA
jgi:hypothetical protein